MAGVTAVTLCGPRPFGSPAAGEVRLLETVDLLDGGVLDGDVDRRGSEAEVLGGERFWSLRVVELAPASAWLSSHVAARCAEYAVVDRPPAIIADVDGVRRGWVQVMEVLGLRPVVLQGSEPQQAGQSSSYDVALLYGALSRAANPLALLAEAAALSDDTLIVIEPVPVDDEGDGGTERMDLLRNGPDVYGPRWRLSQALVGRLLAQAGFARQAASRNRDVRRTGPDIVTIVARRPVRRAAAPSCASLPDPGSAGARPMLEGSSPDLDAAKRLPLPTAADREAVTGTTARDVFVSPGRNAFVRMVHALARNRVAAGQIGQVLDFGCGYSRVLRWWRMFPAVEVHGTDIDVAAIAWNRECLGYGTFTINTLDPRLDHPSGRFDLVHALAVFLQLPEPLQLPWLTELFRVLRPGGHLYFTTRGRSCRGLLPPLLQVAFDAQRLVSGGTGRFGTAACMTFHPPGWVASRLVPAIGADLLELAEWPLDTPGEDCWLLRKPATA